MATYEEIREYRDRHNAFGAALGIRTVEIEDGRAKGQMEIKPFMHNPVGSVHGGCIFSLADTIGGAAAASCGGKMTTISSDFHYLLPAIGSRKLYAQAKEIKRGKRISVCDVEIRNDENKLIGKGTFSYYNMGVLLPENDCVLEE